ncbi:hypothetical protein [Micromonospora marina]|uniref:hypothetical protein n=1 Tax=Micromonospora marina TaxID=307120 RepID=UPI003D749087
MPSDITSGLLTLAEPALIRRHGPKNCPITVHGRHAATGFSKKKARKAQARAREAQELWAEYQDESSASG